MDMDTHTEEPPAQKRTLWSLFCHCVVTVCFCFDFVFVLLNSCPYLFNKYKDVLCKEQDWVCMDMETLGRDYTYIYTIHMLNLSFS